jgi:hypothetical protein
VVYSSFISTGNLPRLITFERDRAVSIAAGVKLTQL